MKVPYFPTLKIIDRAPHSGGGGGGGGGGGMGERAPPL